MKLKANLNCENLPKILELLNDKECISQYNTAKFIEMQARAELNHRANEEQDKKYKLALTDAGLSPTIPHVSPANADEEWENEEWKEATLQLVPPLKYPTEADVLEYLQSSSDIYAIPELVEWEKFPILAGIRYLQLGFSSEATEYKLRKDFKDLELAPVVEIKDPNSNVSTKAISLQDTFNTLDDIKNILHKMSAAVSNNGGLNDNDVEFLAGVCSTLFAANSAFPGKAILAVMRSVSNRMFRGKPVSESCIKVCATFLVRFLEQNLDVRGVAKADIMSFAKTAKGLGLDVSGLEWLLSKPEKLVNGVDLQDL